MAIHVAVTRKVKPGSERDFEESLRAFFQESLQRQGVLGVHLLSPPPGSESREYGVLRTFANERERDEFYGSELFKDWEHRVTQLTEGERTYRELHGLEAWFRGPGSPPKWKMALVTWLGVWPTSAVIGGLIGPPLANVPAVLSSAIINAGIVAALTWIVMPALVKVLRSWLQ